MINSIFWLVIIILSVFPTVSQGRIEDNNARTRISIKGKSWYLNDRVINQGSSAEGLLMNVRMVNAVFEDIQSEVYPRSPIGEELSKLARDFDPLKNTGEFTAKIPEYVASGVNAFTISLQGGHPGYEGAVNSAFRPDGTLKEDYLRRVEKVIRACDANHACVILSCFYQRQHSHSSALTGKESIKKAVENTVKWVSDRKFTNVLLEVSNEYRHGGYMNWPDGKWLASEEGQTELIRLAKQLNPSLLVSTSGMGNGKFPEELAEAADFIIIHFNNTSIDQYQDRIKELKKQNKPVICNEDNKLMNEGANALALTTLNGCGWGYMNIRENQDIPFDFGGVNDDPAVYRMFKDITSPGKKVNLESIGKPSVTITYPNDGMIFSVGQSIDIAISHLYPDATAASAVEVVINGKSVLNVEKNKARWQLNETGVFILEAVVKDAAGKELIRSPKVDIIVQAAGSGR